ncbi:ABC transporter ATP-binding protein, partial [bacterium]|nr:ABC transporter ATP-binding protein [bacterium]
IKNINIYNDFKKIFLLPQKITYPTGLTLYEYVTSFFYSNSLKWFITEEEKQQTEKVLEILELSDRKNILIDNLSSGELQKANIATALLSKSDCLFLDEPTSNMDLINQIKILEILKKLKNEDITCVMIIHDLNAAAMYGDYFIGINKDKKIISLEKSEFFTEKNLEDIFGIKIKVVKNNDNVTVQFLN